MFLLKRLNKLGDDPMLIVNVNAWISAKHWMWGGFTETMHCDVEGTTKLYS